MPIQMSWEEELIQCHNNLYAATKDTHSLDFAVWASTQDDACERCEYVCKRRWRFAGEVVPGEEVELVGPSCPVLWKFSPYNPLRKEKV